MEPISPKAETDVKLVAMFESVLQRGSIAVRPRVVKTVSKDLGSFKRNTQSCGYNVNLLVNSLGQEMNVLVADDLKTIRSMLIRTLENFGVDDVDEAEDGQQAIDWLQRKVYDLIIVDHHMPSHLGTDVILEARARGCTGPIIMQTTDCQKSQVMRAIQAGATDYILKPFNSKYLAERLEKHVFNAEMLAAQKIASSSPSKVSPNIGAQETATAV